MKIAPAICSTDASLLMLDRYETAYGIYNHSNPIDNRPLALVGMHWSEDSASGSLMYERISQHMNNNIYKYFGLSLTEFLDLPTDIVSYILEVSGKRLKEEGSLAEDAMTRLGRI